MYIASLQCEKAVETTTRLASDTRRSYDITAMIMNTIDGLLCFVAARTPQTQTQTEAQHQTQTHTNFNEQKQITNSTPGVGVVVVLDLTWLNLKFSMDK